MAVCSSCGKEIVMGPAEQGIRRRGKAYHVSCAPVGLLVDALEEWDAIVARGVEYFLDKYAPSEARSKRASKRKDDQMLVSRFLAIGERLKSEAKARKSRNA